MFESYPVYLIYLDDGGKAGIKVFGGVVIHDTRFTVVESQTTWIAYNLLPPSDKAITEFHASDLFAGTGQFEDIPEDRRHTALRELIQLRNLLGIPYVYSAVDTAALNREPVRSALWLDIAFFMCACAIDDIIRVKHVAPLADEPDAPPLPESPLLSLMVVDEPEQAKHKGRIRDSFRLMRRPITRSDKPDESALSNRLRAPVDEVFFGNSADSIGLQIADVCNWVMWRHLSGDPALDLYDDLMKGADKAPVVCAKPEPEWTRYRHLLRSHD